MSADNDRHGTRPGANGKRWVRSIGAREGCTVLILPSGRITHAYTRARALVASHRARRGYLRTRVHHRVIGDSRRLERLLWMREREVVPRESIFFFSNREHSACRHGLLEDPPSPLPLCPSLRAFRVKCCSESKLIYYPVVIAGRSPFSFRLISPPLRER